MTNFLRLKSVRERTGLAQSTVYKLMSLNEFPKNFRISENAVGWDADDIIKYQTIIKAAQGGPYPRAELRAAFGNAG